MIPHLPPETIAHIISLSLPPPYVAKSLQPRYDLLSVLCLVNRTWRALAQPHFFTHIEYDNKNDRLARLAAAIKGNDELAALARRTQVVQLGFDNDTGFSNQETISGDMGKVMRLHSGLETLWVQWAPAMCASELDQLTNLKFLHIGERSSRAVWIMTRPGVPTPLPTLVHLSLNTTSGGDLEQLLSSPISLFPSLSHLTLFGYHFIGTSTFSISPTPLTAAITSLVLMTYTRDTSDVPYDLLYLFPKITYLQLGCWSNKLPFLERVAMLSKSLLESLVLEWNTASDEDLLKSLDMPHMSSLKSLKLNYYKGLHGISQGSEELREKCRAKGVELEEKWWSEAEMAQKESYYWF
ncbi:hypothetical protein RQP46_005687 [Phenoliferia psychrophenolica]